MFVIGIEILGNAIRSSKEIKGIKIDERNMLKLSQYADDTTAFLEDTESLRYLFSLLSQFENCSGLKINQSKSELLWLGSLRHRKDTFQNLRMNEEPIYALGVYFSYDENLAAKKNFFDRLDSLRKLLNIWSARDISVHGRIQIVKSMAISKLTFVCSVLSTPASFAAEVDKLIFDFIWDYKIPKIKKTTLIKDKENGGLNVINFSLFDKALKICWVKRFCSEGNQPWKIIPLRLLSNVGGTLLFYCNYNVKYLTLNVKLPAFYNEIILHWQEINNVIPKTKKGVLDQIIWNNSFIKINNTSVYFESWHQVGVTKLSSLVDENKTRLLSLHEFSEKFKIKCNFLQFIGLTSAIPGKWKNYLKEENQTNTTNLIAIDKMTCKTIHRLLVENRDSNPPTAEKKLMEMGFSKEECKKIYSIPFVATKEIKPSMFQYKIIHNILYTNAVLHKMKRVEDPFCPYCPNVEQTVTHLFVFCPIAVSFWSDFTGWYQCISKETLTLGKKEIMYGILNNWSSCSALNHLILIGKYLIYCKAINRVNFIFADFKALLHQKIETEKYIAFSSNKYSTFYKKWARFLN